MVPQDKIAYIKPLEVLVVSKPKIKSWESTIPNSSQNNFTCHYSEPFSIARIPSNKFFWSKEKTVLLPKSVGPRSILGSRISILGSTRLMEADTTELDYCLDKKLSLLEFGYCRVGECVEAGIKEDIYFGFFFKKRKDSMLFKLKWS